MRARWLPLILAAARLLVPPAPAVAQEMECASLPGTGSVNATPGVTYMTTPRLACPDGLQIRADSATFFDAARLYQLFGNVYIDNSEVTLRARDAQYFASERRITAQGSVDLLRKLDGTSITGGESLEYYQAWEGNPEDQLTVTGGRPKAVLHPRRPEGASPDSAVLPYQVQAEQRIFVRGENHFEASGNVTILRGDLNAGGDQVIYYGQSGQLQLNGSAYLDAEKYDMRAAMILVTMADDEVTDVLARGDAELIGEKLDIRAPQIELYLAEGSLDRLHAGPNAEASAAAPSVGPPDPERAVATAEAFTIAGYTLEIEITDDVLESVVAVGQARAVRSAPDSLASPDLPTIAQSDWIEGDTVHAIFSAGDPAAPDTAMASDSTTAAQPALESLTARGNARALYRMPASDTAAANEPGCQGRKLFAIHYVTGETIVLTMNDGAIEAMDVTGNVQGLHQEPTAASCSAGSAAAPAVDTSSAATPTTPPPTPRPGGSPTEPTGAARPAGPSRQAGGTP